MQQTTLALAEMLQIQRQRKTLSWLSCKEIPPRQISDYIVTQLLLAFLGESDLGFLLEKQGRPPDQADVTGLPVALFQARAKSILGSGPNDLL